MNFFFFLKETVICLWFHIIPGDEATMKCFMIKSIHEFCYFHVRNKAGRMGVSFLTRAYEERLGFHGGRREISRRPWMKLAWGILLLSLSHARTRVFPSDSVYILQNFITIIEKYNYEWELFLIACYLITLSGRNKEIVFRFTFYYK